MLPNHIHGPNCGCKEYQSMEEGKSRALVNYIRLKKQRFFLEQRFKVVCLNESQANAGKKVFKPVSDKLKTEGSVESDDDAELLFIIPFTTQVKLKSINIRAISEPLAPLKAKIYKNEENVDFSIVDAEPIQHKELLLGPNLGANVECALKIMKLQNVYKLIVHISAENKDKIGITYIGLKGIKTNIKQDQIVIATYESKPNMADHKVPETNKNIQNIE